MPAPGGDSSVDTTKDLSNKLTKLELRIPPASATVNNGSGGVTLFQDTSTAGSATLTANTDSGIIFAGSSNAGTAQITANHATLVSAEKTTAAFSTINTQTSALQFGNDSSAGAATIKNGASGTFSLLVFGDGSTAANAHIIYQAE